MERRRCQEKRGTMTAMMRLGLLERRPSEVEDTTKDADVDKRR
jgi:hypothetical protein